MNTFEVLEFKSIETSLESNLKYRHWSRIYEYPLVLELLSKYSDSSSLVHNTSWGNEDWRDVGSIHVSFKEDLECMFEKGNVLSTDQKKSKLKNTEVYDLTHSPKQEWLEKYDFVLNISTLEEIPVGQVNIFQNLLSMVKVGGYLIVTFDIPGLKINEFEEYFDKKFESLDKKISNGSLTCGYMVIRKCDK